MRYPNISDELYEALSSRAVYDPILYAHIARWQTGTCSYVEAMTAAAIDLSKALDEAMTAAIELAALAPMRAVILPVKEEAEKGMGK